MIIKIDKNIPFPAFEGRGARYVKYPFRDMKIGDSFLAGETGDLRQLRNLRTQASKRGLEQKKVFRVRETDEGYRCWRIK